MPIYEFKCNDCGGVFETFVLSPRHAKEIKCPQCGSSKIVKLLSSFACASASAPRSSAGVSSGSSCGTGRFT